MLDFFHEIKDLVDQRVKEKIHNLPKKTHRPIDKATLEESCTQEVFHELEGPLFHIVDNMTRFQNLIKEENPKLNEKIIKHFESALGKEKNINTFQEMVEFGKKNKLPSALLDQVYDMGSGYCRSRDLEKALLCFHWMCVFDAKNPKIWYMKGAIEQNLQKFHDALVSYYQVIAINPDYINVYTQLMNCLILMGDLDTAREIFEAFTHGVAHKTYEDDHAFCENLRCIKKILY